VINEEELLSRVPTRLLIDGVWTGSATGATFSVLDPPTGHELLHVADATPGDADPRPRRGRGGAAFTSPTSSDPNRPKCGFLRQHFQ
jgi:hypothetical protein